MSDRPFGSSRAGARALVLDVSAAGTRLGAVEERVTDGTLDAWLDEGGARVALRILGYEALPTAAVERVESLARHLTHLYAAALVWDATHPERGGMGGGGSGTRLSDSLMARFDAGLTDLAGYVTGVLAGDGPVVVVPGAEPVDVPAAHFPAVRIGERTGF